MKKDGDKETIAETENQKPLLKLSKTIKFVEFDDPKEIEMWREHNQI